jgi:predicted SAM-dependent methyltransferase
MKIQISPTRIVPDALVIWNEHGPEVDVVMDVKNLTFKEDSIEEIYAFHVLERLFESEIPVAIESWKKCLAPGKEVFIISDDFEFVARSFVGGEMSIDKLNTRFSYPTRLTRENIVRYLRETGFSEHDMRFWFVDVPDRFPKKDFELVVSSKKL